MKHFRLCDWFDFEDLFMGITDCSTSREAKRLTAMIFDFLKKYDSENVFILAQSYDDVSVMLGKHKALQKLRKSFLMLFTSIPSI